MKASQNSLENRQPDQKQDKVGGKQSGKKKKKAKDNLCVDANGPVLGCVRSTACRQSVSVFWWMRACMAFRWQRCTVIRRKARACPRADSISVAG